MLCNYTFEVESIAKNRLSVKTMDENNLKLSILAKEYSKKEENGQIYLSCNNYINNEYLRFYGSAKRIEDLVNARNIVFDYIEKLKIGN